MKLRYKKCFETWQWFHARGYETVKPVNEEKTIWTGAPDDKKALEAMLRNERIRKDAEQAGIIITEDEDE